MPGRYNGSQAEVKAELATAYGAPIELVERLQYDDVYTRGRALLVVPGLFEGLHPAINAAVLIRRVATLSGRCPHCDQVGPLADGNFMHDNECPATVASIRALRKRYRPRSYAYETRLDDPQPLSRVIDGRVLWRLDAQGNRVDTVILRRVDAL